MRGEEGDKDAKKITIGCDAKSRLGSLVCVALSGLSLMITPLVDLYSHSLALSLDTRTPRPDADTQRHSTNYLLSGQPTDCFLEL